MCAKWRDQIAPEAIIEALRPYEKPRPTGGRSFEGGMGGIIDLGMGAIESFIEFHDDVPSRERHAMANRALFNAKTLTPKQVLAEASRAERAFLSRSLQPFFVYTTLSMQQPPLLRRRDVGETRLAFGKPIDPEVLSNLDARLDRFVSHTVPEDYLPVRAYVKARSVEEAYEVGQNAIDFVRGLWNLCWNMGGQGFRISSGRAAPVNKILLGPTRTVHNADGELAEENFWYNPGYYGPMPLANRLTEKWDAIQKFERKARRAIKRSASSTLLTRLVVRYVRSLDEEILETSFLKLWTLLEILTGTRPGDSYDLTIKRTSRLFVNPNLHAEILRHFRVSRNIAVHQFESPEFVEQLLFQLKFYVETTLRRLIHTGKPPALPGRLSEV